MNDLIKKLAEKSGGFPLGAEADETYGFRERALERFADSIVKECIYLCEQHGNSAPYSYTPAKAKLVEKAAYGCGQLIARKFGVEK